MSASRAIASAKNKKAGINSPNPATPFTEQEMNKGIEQSQQSITKLTIPQALHMIIKRLDVVEGRMNELETTLQETRVFGEHTENKYLIDAKVFDSIVSRLDNLENNKESLRNIIDNKNEQTLETNITHIQNSLNDFKNDFIKLQTYVMDTNAKLTDIVFSIPTESIVEYRELFSKKTADEEGRYNEDTANNYIKINRNNVSDEHIYDIHLSNIPPPKLTRQTNSDYVSNENLDRFFVTSDENLFKNKEIVESISSSM